MHTRFVADVQSHVLGEHIRYREEHERRGDPELHTLSLPLWTAALPKVARSSDAHECEAKPIGLGEAVRLIAEVIKTRAGANTQNH